jgi:thiosulfate/3-mercaptopyruvate sulfurtransferase
MEYINSESLVDTAWLEAHLDDPNVKILDGSWHLPATERDGLAEYTASHIPGAEHFDINAVSDKASSLPHMLPTADAFAVAVGAMAITNNHRVIVYDADGLFSAPRVWWMFRVFGHDNVALLSGGFRKWTGEGRKVTADTYSSGPTTFTAKLNSQLVRSLDQIERFVEDESEIILDARAADRFAGESPEARPGVEAGHIPGSSNLPYQEITNLETGMFRDAAALAKVFEDSGLNDGKPIVTTCGSGISACILGMGLHLMGNEDWSVYDGSWTEWGGREDTPKAKGSQ